MNGDNWNCIYHPESRRLLKRVYDAKHQIAAHPWSHRNLESLSDKDIRQEMNRIEEAFRQIIGVVPRYMRPPYGEHGERVRRVLEEMEYIIVLWDVDLLGHSAEPLATDSSDEYSNEKPMTGSRHRHHQDSMTSKWAEAVRGVPSTTLDRNAMMLGGIYQEATSIWAVEYVQSLGYEVMPVARCLGEDDPRLWYKEVSPPADPESLPQTCR
ncbi:Carbohydrate esterase 4 protein [Mortierella polycephala]|uniref:Carbohydrate esterase 4 protein n=1 Tax=Mortierella polycephala TaxID=41804 RepID=A0A9P6PJC1_9FUNG|nr:Carbohydrate esterase 4 protein [Mortierella polycephala]